MKYIFVAGAPGSKWSAVAFDIYCSDSIDRSDFSNDRLFYGKIFGKPNSQFDKKQPIFGWHAGSYFDPGFEFSIPEHLSTWTKAQCNNVFDKPFSSDSQGIRIIKSHIFCYTDNIDYLKRHWPTCPIVLVQRPSNLCFDWWTSIGNFDIAYPNYKPYYQNLDRMKELIIRQNTSIQETLKKYNHKQTKNSFELCELLGILKPDIEDIRPPMDYHAHKVEVYVI